MMIKVLVINTVRFKLNGISAVIQNYYMAMDKKDIVMDFIAVDDPSPEYQKFFEENHLNCFVIYKKNPLKYFLSLIKTARNGDYDVVHIHGNSANMALEMLACYMAGIKVRIGHSHNTATLHPFTHKILFLVFNWLCTTRIACGQEAGKWLYGSRQFTELKNGIDLNRYRFSQNIREEYRKKLKVENKIVIGHIGNFIEQKNHEFLISWFAELLKENQKYVLLLISDGYLMDKIRKKVDQLNISSNVIFLGKTMKVEKYLQAMDLFVLPSLYEGLPLVLVEAQAAGLPCIVSDTISKQVDVTDSIEFVSIKKTSAWTEAVQKCCDKNQTDNSSRENRSENWQQKISEKGYDITTNANSLREHYIKAVNKKENSYNI